MRPSRMKKARGTEASRTGSRRTGVISADAVSLRRTCCSIASASGSSSISLPRHERTPVMNRRIISACALVLAASAAWSQTATQEIRRVYLSQGEWRGRALTESGRVIIAVQEIDTADGSIPPLQGEAATKRVVIVFHE